MSEQVHAMFSDIASKYDRANAVLSLGIHRLWRRKAVRMSGAQRGSSVLDCATGTGDLAIEFARTVGKNGRVVGTDFNKEMLAYAPHKALDRGLDIMFELADAMKLQYDSNTFDVCSIAFGIRNVDDASIALTEMARVVKPSGRVVVLEFGQPRGAFGIVYRWYSKYVIPVVGKVITGKREPFEYLPTTAATFPAGQRFVDVMNNTKAFASVTTKRLTGGVAFVYVGIVR